MADDRQIHAATLLMESHGLAPNVRSTSFASVKVWAKLYQAGPYFLDLNLVPGEEGLNLRGEVLIADDTESPESGTATLHGPDGSVLAQAELDAALTFRVPIAQAGRYRLEVVLVGETLSIDELIVD